MSGVSDEASCEARRWLALHAGPSSHGSHRPRSDVPVRLVSELLAETVELRRRLGQIERVASRPRADVIDDSQSADSWLVASPSRSSVASGSGPEVAMTDGSFESVAEAEESVAHLSVSMTYLHLEQLIPNQVFFPLFCSLIQPRVYLLIASHLGQSEFHLFVRVDVQVYEAVTWLYFLFRW